MTDFEKLLTQYDYQLPQKLIALKPAHPRDTARLLIYQKKSDKIFFDRFNNLAKYLPKNAVLVFNQTKVLPARLNVKKNNGGNVSLLYVRIVGQNIEVMSNRGLKPGDILTLSSKINFRVIKPVDRYYLLKPSFAISQLETILEKYGITPLPPYLESSPLSEKKRRELYQTIFARQNGSIAAPTASLHFTKKLLTHLKKEGIGIEYITLHVGLGTFAPLTEKQIGSGKLHQEYYEIDRQTASVLHRAKKQGRPIIAVGTTVVRTLETATKTKKLHGQTDLFITPGYQFKMIDGVITNFHVPKSSLLMLVAAFSGRQTIFDLYQKAIAKKFHFFSFGDGMLVY